MLPMIFVVGGSETHIVNADMIVIARPHSFMNATRETDMTRSFTRPSVCPPVSRSLVSCTV